MIKKLQNLSLGWKFVLIQIVCISVTVTTVSMTATFVYNRYVNESILRDRGYEAAYAANQALLKISQVQAQSQWRAASSTVKNILHTGNVAPVQQQELLLSATESFVLLPASGGEPL